MREYHSFRFNGKHKDFEDTAVQNAPDKKKKAIVGKKVRRKINRERKKIITYHKDLTKNVHHNLTVLKRMAIHTEQSAPQWQERLDMIRNATHALGKK